MYAVKCFVKLLLFSDPRYGSIMVVHGSLFGGLITILSIDRKGIDPEHVVMVLKGIDPGSPHGNGNEVVMVLTGI